MPATSKAQQRFMGLVKAYQDGDVPPSKVSKAVKDAAKSMGEKEVDKYASTKHKGLPNKKERIESILKENPVAIAATQGALRAMKKAKVPGKAGKPISAVTALKDKSQPAHKKAKGIFAKLVDKLKKKKKPKAEPKKQPKKQSKSDADFYKKQFGVGRTGKELKKENVEHKLRRIIKEEVKKVINEGTRWLVGIEGNNGKILSTYGHYDGYPQHTGKLLKKVYNSPQRVKQMMKLGRSGISFLDKSMKGGKDHSFENPKKGESIFYGRDRGEKDNWTSNWKDRDAVKFDSGEEYAYIYNMKEKKWYYKSRYSNPQDWTEL